jgi:hypothetical protein
MQILKNIGSVWIWEPYRIASGASF